MEKTILLALMMAAIITPTVWIGPTRLLSESAEALKYPYWSTHPVNIGPEYKQVHVTILNDVPDSAPGKTKIVLNLWVGRIDDSIDLASHVINIPKPTEKNETVDAGFFIVPRSLAESAGASLTVGINILKEDVEDSGGTVNQQLNDTVFSVEDYYDIT
jgi:hypothetical protein